MIYLVYSYISILITEVYIPFSNYCTTYIIEVFLIINSSYPAIIIKKFE